MYVIEDCEAGSGPGGAALRKETFGFEPDPALSFPAFETLPLSLPCVRGEGLPKRRPKTKNGQKGKIWKYILDIDPLFWAKVASRKSLAAISGFSGGYSLLSRMEK